MKRLNMTEEQIERESIEQVFRLTGGELENEPLVFFESKDEDDAEFRANATKFSHWYEGVPEYAYSDFEDADGSGHKYTHDSTNFFTAIRDVTFGPPDRFLRLANGETWERVTSYSTSGETECPFRDYDPQDRGVGFGYHDTPKSADGVYLVTRHSAQLSPKLEPHQRREPSKFLTGAYYQRPNARHARCPYCEARIGEEHGYIYLGDGYAEVVYTRILASKDDRENLKSDLAHALEIEHPCSAETDNACDIGKAMDCELYLWAARILTGATECPRTTRVYSLINPTEAELEEEREALLQEPHGQCPKCNAVVWFGDYYDATVTCGNCHADVPTGKSERDESDEDIAHKCEGHPSGENDPMGQTVYCDGTCKG